MPASVMLVLQEANLIEFTGWTPQQIAVQPAAKLHELMAVWSSRQTIPKHDKKMMK